MIYEKDIDLSIFEPYKINCEKCCGLCCVALYFSKTDGFPKDKVAGKVCDNLQNDHKCKMHAKLYKQGLKGCMSYDCFGAGQVITSHLESLPNWRTIAHEEASKIFNAYYVVLNVHQILWHLSQCLILRLSQKEKAQASVLIKEGSILIEKPLEMLSVLDGQAFSDKSNTYFKHVFGLYHPNARNTRKKQAINYMGKNMQRKNLTRTDFSRSLLIATNLVQANLYGASFFGADMRDTNICDTDVSNCLFLTQFQINSAKGNRNTMLPPYIHKPKIWEYDERETLLLPR